jgi:hypothetical protein
MQLEKSSRDRQLDNIHAAPGMKDETSERRGEWANEAADGKCLNVLRPQTFQTFLAIDSTTARACMVDPREDG